MDHAHISFLFLSFLNEILYWPATDKVGASYLRTTLWAPCVVLHIIVEALQADHALNGGAVRTHPDFARDQIEAQDALAELICVQAGG